MEFEKMMELSRNIENEFRKIENRSWTVETIVIELTKQVGDLCKVILNYEGYYLDDRKNNDNYKSDVDGIGNELADILHQIIKIADHYKIDLVKAHIEARKGEEKYIKMH